MSQCGSSSCAMRIVYAVSITIGSSAFPSALRARIDGAVMRLPGTGTGVARLVEVSMVNVDIGRSSNGPIHSPPVERPSAQPAALPRVTGEPVDRPRNRRHGDAD